VKVPSECKLTEEDSSRMAIGNEACYRYMSYGEFRMILQG